MVTVPQSLLKLTKLAKPKATHSASPDPFQGDHNKAFVLRLSPPPPLHSPTPDPCWYHFMWYYTPPSLGSCAEQTVLSHCSSPDRLALSYLKFSYFLNDFFMWTIFKTLYWICYNIALFFLYFGVFCCCCFSHKAYRIIVPWPRIKPALPALEGKVPNTAPPGKSLKFSIKHLLVEHKSLLSHSHHTPHPPPTRWQKTWVASSLSCFSKRKTNSYDGKKNPRHADASLILCILEKIYLKWPTFVTAWFKGKALVHSLWKIH